MAKNKVGMTYLHYSTWPLNIFFHSYVTWLEGSDYAEKRRN